MSELSRSAAYRQWGPAVVSVAALVLLLVWLEGGFARKVEPGTVRAEVAHPSLGPTVPVVAEETGTLMSWPGTVVSRTETEISPKIASRIEAILVRPGDRIKRGQVMVRLDERSLQARLAQARSALAAAQAEAARQRADTRRTENLFRKEAATQQMLDTAVAAAKAADARVREAQSAIEEVASLFAETALTAPFDGIVLKRRREPGDTALPGAPILTLLEPGWLRVEVAIPESCASAIRAGQALTVAARDGGSRELATVEEIAPSADRATHTLPVKARLPRDTALMPGAFVRVGQVCGQTRILTIPASAVIRTGQIESVRLVEDGRAKLRHVRTGKRRGDRIEILSGLAEGDTVLKGAP